MATTTFRCPTCFDAQKVLIGEELSWCENCVPPPWRSQPTTPEENLNDLRDQRKRDKLTPTGYNINYGSTDGLANYTITMPGDLVTTNTTAAFDAEANTVTADLLPGWLDAETPDPSFCQSCGVGGTSLYEKVESIDTYMYSIEKDGDQWKVYAEHDGSENVGTITPMSFECINCGNHWEVELPIEWP